MKATFSVAVLVLVTSAWTPFASEFTLPMSAELTEEILQETMALCNKNIKDCWFNSESNPSEYICGSDQISYRGECQLCFKVVYEGKNIIKTNDGQCENFWDELEH